MIHSTVNKDNFILLFKIVSKAYHGHLEYLKAKDFYRIDNLCFIINELIKKENIPNGIYNITDEIFIIN